MVQPQKEVVRIGGAAGALVDSLIAVPQLLGVKDLDYLIFDYLAEGSMGIFERLRAADSKAGFSADFADQQIGPYLAEIKSRGVRIVSNAGGLNPHGLAELLRAKAKDFGIALKVGVVEGDNLKAKMPQFRKQGITDMFTRQALPENAGSVNAYLGAFPIAAALDAGADIVVTGRVVDSAMVLGPLIHEFGWGVDDHDLLSAGTVAGHLLECGAQVSGGTFTDWEDVPGWENIGFPVGECRADGSVVITKPEGTGGLVSVGTVSEQLLYEVGDPQSYIVPDVVCDFTTVVLRDDGPNRVHVSGATGYPPPEQLKVCATYADGWRSIALQPVIGVDARRKAERQRDAILSRMTSMLCQKNLGDFRQVYTEILGAGDTGGVEQVLLKMVVDHDDPRATGLFWREQNSAIMNMAVGTSISPVLTAPPTFPLTNMALFLVPRGEVEVQVTVEGQAVPSGPNVQGGFKPSVVVRPEEGTLPEGAEMSVPLVSLAWVRSGDKGDLFNVGVIARRPEYLPYLQKALTTEKLAEVYRAEFNDPARQRVERYLVLGIHALNFVVYEAQGGGISMSPRLDAAAKSMGQHLLGVEIPVSADIAREIGKGERVR